MLATVFDKFVEKSPISVMARGMIERVLNPVQLNQWYDTTAKAQYTKTLLFSSVFDIMNNVVCGSHHRVNAAFQASEGNIGVSITSLYNKLNGIVPETIKSTPGNLVEKKSILAKSTPAKFINNA
jgi:hypothetical protein